jgi:hypothetical protein
MGELGGGGRGEWGGSRSEVFYVPGASVDSL